MATGTSAYRGEWDKRVYDPSFPGIWIAVTPANTDFTYVACAVLCTTAGNCILRNQEDASDVTIPMVAGQTIVGRFCRVGASSTGTYFMAY